MTAATLRTLVRGLVGVPSNHPRLQDSDIDTYVDELMQELAWDGEPVALQDSDPIDIVAGTALYTTTKKFLWLDTVKAFGTKLEPISYAELDRLDPGWEASTAGRGTPRYYTIDSTDASTGYFKIRLYPTPESSGDDGLIARGLIEPTPMATIANGEIVQWPELMGHKFAKGAAVRAVDNLPERGGLDSRVANWRNDWLEGRAKFIERQHRAHAQRWGQTPVAGIEGGWETPQGW